MRKQTLWLLPLLIPIETLAFPPKPMGLGCGRLEVIISNVTQDQVLKDIVDRSKVRMDSVVVTVPDTTQSCLARCGMMSATPESSERRTCVSLCNAPTYEEPRSDRVDIVIADKTLVDQPAVPEPDGTGKRRFESARIQITISEARSGVRLEASLGMVSSPGSDHELVYDYTAGSSEELLATLNRPKQRLDPSSTPPPPPTASEYKSAVRAALAQIELGRQPLIYVFSESTDQLTRSTIGGVRRVAEFANVVNAEGALPPGHALITKVEVHSDDATVRATVGPTGRRLQCGSPITVLLKSKRDGWSVCGRQEMAC